MGVQNLLHVKRFLALFQPHRGEAMYIFLLISHGIAQKEMALSSLIIHHLIIITCISYKIIFAKSLPKLINITPLYTCVMRVTDSIRHCNTDYSGLEWGNINTFWYWYDKYTSIADAGIHD